jgi:hypothetical protein
MSMATNMDRFGSAPDHDHQKMRRAVEPPKQGCLGTLLWVTLTFASLLSAAIYMEASFCRGRGADGPLKD